jgi:hypothetical protein
MVTVTGNIAGQTGGLQYCRASRKLLADSEWGKPKFRTYSKSQENGKAGSNKWYPVIMTVREKTSNTGYLILGLTAENNTWALESDSCLTVCLQVSLSTSVGASLAIFLGFTVSGIHLGVLTLSLLAAFC